MHRNELQTIIKWTGAHDPYGDGSDGVSSEYISVAESWAEHVARLMCDRQYGTNSTDIPWFGGTTYDNGFPEPTLTSHLNYLEDYNPGLQANPFHWIPVGIFYDLVDNRNDIFFGRVNVNDQVSSYSNQQLFNALDADITSMPQYGQRLLQENNLQPNEVRTLFTAYGYPF